jgi:hypothetical protein
MTRVERARQAEARARARAEAQRKQRLQLEALQRAKERKARDRRRYLVGLRADEAGWLGLSDATIVQLFQGLRPLVETADPVGTLAALVQGTGRDTLDTVPGSAPPADGVPPVVAVGSRAR